MLNLVTGLEFHTLIMLGLALVFVLFYEAINGFHDTANAIAIVIYTRSMREKLAVIMAALGNFFGVLLGGLSVAYAIIHLLPTDLLLNINSNHGLVMVFAILISAIIWNLGTWYIGIPASSSHTLIGAIIGVALMNAILTDTSIIAALNLRELKRIFLSLILSPLIGLILAGMMILFLRKRFSGSKKKQRIHLTPAEREKQDGKRKPPFWIRLMLIISAAGVSFSHGANDGQKGIGLLMLVLIGIAPASFVVNLNADRYELFGTKDALNHLQQYYKTHYTDLTVLTAKYNSTTAFEGMDNEYHCDVNNALAIIHHTQSLLDSTDNYQKLSPDDRALARRLLLCVADTAAQVAKLPSTSLNDARYLMNLKKDILVTIEYAPKMIIIMVAIALAVGTMIGWHRIAVTIGEKIGKRDMTYAQGVATQTTTALSIGIASYTGLPVSTTQVLSSAVAGSMLAAGVGIQTKTIKSIALAWLLTLPISILLSSCFYWIMLQFI